LVLDDLGQGSFGAVNCPFGKVTCLASAKLQPVHDGDAAIYHAGQARIGGESLIVRCWPQA